MPWLQLKIDVPAAQAERIETLMEEAGAEAVSLEDARDQPLYEPPPGATPLWADTRVVGLFPAEADAEAIAGTLSAALGDLPPHSFETLDDQDWTRAWMDRFQPMRFGEHLWICPSWCPPPDPEGVNILLDPGLAFGTGTHPTTALCLEWLDAHPPAGKLVVDYGCGSGILAIAAAKLGARHLWAVDNDPQALEASEANAEHNEIPARNFYTALPEDLPPLQAEVLLANILAEPLITLAPTFAELVEPGGELVLSGILADQAERVAAAYAPWFRMEPPATREEWVRLAGRRHA